MFVKRRFLSTLNLVYNTSEFAFKKLRLLTQTRVLLWNYLWYTGSVKYADIKASKKCDEGRDNGKVEAGSIHLLQKQKRQRTSCDDRKIWVIRSEKSCVKLE